MQYDDFIIMTKESQPSIKLFGVHLAIWYATKNNWDMAHNVVQNINTEIASWIHAYLHRVEGDMSNANYWYKRNGTEYYIGDPGEELEEIANLMIRSSNS